MRGDSDPEEVPVWTNVPLRFVALSGAEEGDEGGSPPGGFKWSSGVAKCGENTGACCEHGPGTEVRDLADHVCEAPGASTPLALCVCARARGARGQHVPMVFR